MYVISQVYVIYVAVMLPFPLQLFMYPSEHAHMGTTWVFGGQLGNWALHGPIYWSPSGLSLGLNELL